MAKRAGGSVEGEGGKKQRTEEQPVGPFGKATKYRTFKIIVDGKGLFISPYHLAEMSPFFEALCLGNTIGDVDVVLKHFSHDDVIEMLHVLGGDYVQDRKAIDTTNCARMLPMATRWKIDLLMNKCVKFLETEFPEVYSNLQTAYKLLLACEANGITGVAVQNVASRLAAFGVDAFKEHRLTKLREIKDSRLRRAILSAAEDMPVVGDMSHSMYDRLGRAIVDTKYGKCGVDDCNERTHMCVNCAKVKCYEHRTTFSSEEYCSKWMYGKISTNVNLDKRLMGIESSDSDSDS